MLPELDAATGCEIAGCIGADDTAVAEEAVDTGAADAERALADTGVMDRGTEITEYRQVTWVYFIRAVTVNRVKVGITASLENRLAAYRTHWPDELQLMGTVRCGSRPSAIALESKFLDVTSKKDRLHGEWVKCSSRVMERIGDFVASFQERDSVRSLDRMLMGQFDGGIFKAVKR